MFATRLIQNCVPKPFGLLSKYSKPAVGAKSGYRGLLTSTKPQKGLAAGEKTPLKYSSTQLAPLRFANELYAIFRVHNRPYLVTRGDTVILPFKVKTAEVGDILNLTDVITIGSRNYRLVDYPIDPSVFNLKATVLEKTKRKFTTREVTKRRNRRVRHAHSKCDLTVIRISELHVN